MRGLLWVLAHTARGDAVASVQDDPAYGHVGSTCSDSAPCCTGLTCYNDKHVPDSGWYHCIETPPQPAPVVALVQDDRICSWAQEYLVHECNQEYPDSQTGCAAGTILGTPFSGTPTTESMFCLTANQPFVHFGFPICETTFESGGA